MSMCNLIVQPSIAYLITDSGYYREGGVVGGLAPKVFAASDVALAASPHPMAFANVGKSVLPGLYLEMGDRLDAPNFGLDAFKAMVREIYDRKDVGPSWFFAAGYSRKTGRAFGYTFLTHVLGDEAKARKKAWTWYPVRHLLVPEYDRVDAWGVDAIPDLTDPDIFDPLDDALPLVEAQRRNRHGWGADSHVEGCMVAGEIMLTAVSARGVDQIPLHTYPDRVGELAGAD